MTLLTTENNRPVANPWQTLSRNVVSRTSRHDLDSNSQLEWWYALIAQVVGNPTIKSTTTADGIYLEIIQKQNTSPTIYRNVSNLFWNKNLHFFEEIYSIRWTLICRLKYNKKQYIICFNMIIDWLRVLGTNFVQEAMLYHLIGLVISIATITQCNLSSDLNARQVYFTQDKLHLISNVFAFLSLRLQQILLFDN